MSSSLADTADTAGTDGPTDAGGTGRRTTRTRGTPRRDPRPEIVDDVRPWGGFEQLSANEVATVKILTVTAGHRLSLQRHEHRDELWTVLDVEVEVEIGERRWRAAVGDKLWIPRGTRHRLTNRTGRTARVLEVAFGRFDEADIERFEDDYAR